MAVIGVDPHKNTHIATAVDPSSNVDLGSVRIEATLSDYRCLIAWARRWPQRQWAVENADGLGRHLARWLIARSEVVLDIPTTATARVRELLAVVDVRTIGSTPPQRVSRLCRERGRPAVADEHCDALRILDEQRNNLSASRTRSVNQLNALLRELLAGGAPTRLTANTAATVRIPSTDDVESVPCRLCKDLIADVRRLDRQLAANQKLLDEHGTRMRRIDGIGPVLAARLIGRTGPAPRFATTAEYATYNGDRACRDRQLRSTPPPAQIDASTSSDRRLHQLRSTPPPAQIDASTSSDRRLHQLSRYGARQLNAAIHNAAMVQVRMRDTAGRA
ncbi:IS110 family transposase [Nocardia takedensis]|uniref:hypothetical protein n=1 Tax=Nocardia takedensis TaxID=259390 RepID=UPI0002E1FC6A|nr:hypothetical protein [Nocardia takedensis]